MERESNAEKFEHSFSAWNLLEFYSLKVVPDSHDQSHMERRSPVSLLNVYTTDPLQVNRDLHMAVYHCSVYYG